MTRARAGLAALLLGMASSVMMQTMLATAAPRIAEELGGSTLYGWVFAAYLASYALTLPLFGQLADLHGRRPLYVLGMGTYAAATLLAALAPGPEWLIAARLLQGVGAGALVPAALATVADLVEAPARGRVFGLIGVVQVLANMLGPLLGAWFTDGPGWRWGLGAIAGSATATGVLAAATLPPAIGQPWQRWWRAVDWWLPLRLFGNPCVRRVTIQAALLGAALMAAIAYIALLVQGVHARSAGCTGGVLTSMMVAAGIGSVLGGRAATGACRAAVTAAWGAVTIGFTLLAVASRSTTGLVLPAAASAMIGLGTGLVAPILLTRVQEDTDERHTASAGGMVQLGRTAGGAVGTPVLGLWVAGALPLADGLGWLFLSAAGTALAGLILHLVVPDHVPGVHV